MIRYSKLLAVMIALCLLCSLPGAALAQTAETPPETAHSGGWPEEMIGSWVGLHENLWRQYSFYRNGRYGLTVFEDPSLNSEGTWETFGKDYSAAVDGDLMQLTLRGTTGTFRRVPEPYAYVRLKPKVAAVDPSVYPWLVGTWGGRIKETYVERTFGADGSFSQFTPAEASVLEGYYIAGGLDLAIKTGGKFIHCTYMIRQDTLTVDLPDGEKVILNRKPGQLKEMTIVDNGNILWIWPADREPRGPVVWRYLGSETEVGMFAGGYTPVVGIGDEAFKGNKTLESVTVPDFVTEIGNAAFEGCESLRDVLFIGTNLSGVYEGAYEEFLGFSVIPGSCPLKTIGDHAFRGCANLENLNIAKSARESPSSQYFTQLGWSDVRGINLPDGLETIGAYAFEGCESITRVSIPDSVTEIGKDAFKGCGLVTLIVAEFSYAYNYAKSYGIPFILRGE